MDKSQISAFVNGFDIDQYRKNIMYDLIVTIIENAKGNKFIANDAKPGNIKIGYQLNNNNYPLLLDKDGKAYVTIPIATLEQLGVIKTGYAQNGKNYPLLVDSQGNAYVNVPWSATTSLPASSIIEDSNHRFVTDEQIAYWNSKADSTPPAEPAVAILERE